MSHARRSDWSANVPWSGILDKPAGLGGDTDIGQLKGAGFAVNYLPLWNGTKFVPAPYNPGGGGGDIGDLDVPGVATKRIKPGTSDVENVWLQEVFDICQYGADNTGALDSTSNINAAINALNATGGGALIIPAGRYRAAGPMQRILGRCWVHGDGQGTTIIEFAGDGWWVTSGTFFGCTGLTMTGSNPVGTGIKIMDSASVDNFLLTDLRISGFGYGISVETVNRSGWIERVRLESLELALSLNASDSFVRGICIYNGGDNTKNAFEMTGYGNQVSDFKISGDAANFKKGIFVNDGGNHIISAGIIMGCDEEAISLSNGTGGVSGCRVQNISWLDIGTSPDPVSFDDTINNVNDLYEIGTGTVPIGTVTNTGPLTVDQIVVGNGGVDVKSLAAGMDTYVMTMTAGIPGWAPSSGGGSGTVNSGTANQLAYYSATGATVSGLTSANSSILSTNASGVPGWGTVLPNFTVTPASGDSTITLLPPASGTAHLFFQANNNGGSICDFGQAGASNAILTGSAAYDLCFFQNSTTQRILFGTASGAAIGLGLEGNNAGLSWAGSTSGTIPIKSSLNVFPATGTSQVAIKATTAATAKIIFQSNNDGPAVTDIGVAGSTNSLITGSAVGDMCFRINGNNQSFLWSVDTSTIALKIVGNSGEVSAEKTTNSTTPTTGALISKGGLGVASDIVTGGSIKTGTPATGTSAAWKFGSLVTAAVTPDTSRYIQLDVGGTLYKLIVST